MAGSRVGEQETADVDTEKFRRAIWCACCAWLVFRGGGGGGGGGGGAGGVTVLMRGVRYYVLRLFGIVNDDYSYAEIKVRVVCAVSIGWCPR